SSPKPDEPGPNISGCEREGWLRHPITSEDTMTRLALKYDTSIGQICRANRMHCQDVLQTRRHIWVPVPVPKGNKDIPLPLLPVRAFRRSSSPTLLVQESQKFLKIPPRTANSRLRVPRMLVDIVRLPPHFYRQSGPNPNLFADEGDPLLITTKI
ncbi:hypothetical protein KR009_003800, partial [Drosophila setifemur]